MRNKVVKTASNEVGYKEGANNENKYSRELYGKAQEWCADFVRWILKKVGAEDLFPVSSYVPTVANWYDEKGQYKNSKAYGGNYTPQAGDLILFDYNRNTTSDHIGIVEKVEDGKVYTIEGNKDNMVKKCIYSLSDKDIRAYCTPDYPVEETKSIDELAQEVIDGKWGNGTDRKNKLENAGYNYNEIQNRVNEMLKGKTVYKTVTSNIGLNLREKADTSAKILIAIPKNKKVEIIKQNTSNNDGYKWDKVKYNNITGYVANKYLK